MGNVILFAHPNNKQKMETLYKNSNFEHSLRTDVLERISETFKHPEVVARAIRDWYVKLSYSYAFPVIELAKDLNIQVIVADFSTELSSLVNNSKTIKGYLGLYPTAQNRPPRIVVSSSESYGHQRWTVAHELWHYLMHAQNEQSEVTYFPEDSLNYNLSDNSEEAYANRFATELLMPEYAFRYAYKSLPIWNRKSKLAQMFMVSKEAVKRRIQALEL